MSGEGPFCINTWSDAEVFAVSVLRAWGYHDAGLTKGGADAGLDIHGTNVLGQVKHRSAQTGRPDIQRLFGARGVGTQDLVFFSRSGYSPPAVDYAETHDVALFSYDESGQVTAHTRSADRMMPAQEVQDVRLAPGRATNGATPDDGGVGCFLFGILAGAAFAIWIWATSDHPGGVGGLFGMLAMCGFIGALLAVSSEENAAKRKKRK
jgi:hypothetical protein